MAIKVNVSDFDKLKLDEGIINTEAYLYLVNNVIYKIFINESDFLNKSVVLSELILNKDLILDITDKLVLPEEIVSINSECDNGYSMKYIEGVALKEKLADSNVDILEKVDLLKQVGNILEDMSLIRDNKNMKSFYLNDMHEDNFLVDKSGILKVIDIDSSRIGDNYSIGSKYLISDSRELFNYPDKYEIVDNPYFSYIKPNAETEIYCYDMMIINFLLGNYDSHMLSKNEYFSSLKYFCSNGMNSSLANDLSLVYSNEKNINPVNNLDGIVNMYKKIK